MKAKKLVISSLFSAAMLNANAAVDANQIVNFSAGSPAKAAEVNQTIAELVRAINANAESISALQEKLTVDNSVAGRCYDYQATYQKLRNYEDDFGQVVQGNVEIGDVGGTIRFDSANPTAQLIGEENHTAMYVNPSQKAGSFIMYDDYATYEKPVGSSPVDRQVQWAQSGDTVTIVYTPDDPSKSYDLTTSADGSLLTGTFRIRKSSKNEGSTVTSSKYELQDITLREVSCSQ